MNSPKLRFPNFRKEWKMVHLNQIVNRVVRKNNGLNSTLPLTISAQHGLVDQTTYFNKSVASSNLEGYYLLNNGEFAYNKSYSNGYPYGAIKRLNKYDKGVLSTLYICFSATPKINSDYLEKYFDSSQWFKEISAISVEGARNHGLLNVAVNDFFQTVHYVPDLKEQQKIAKFFETINQRIEKQQEKVDLLKKQKKGLMQKIFKQELRFKNEKKKEYLEWEERTLEELCKINTGNKDTQDKKDDGLYPFFVRSQIVEKIDTYSFDGEAILTAGDGVGVGKVFHYINGKFDYHQRVYMLSDFKNCVGKYIYYYFTQNFMKEAKKYNAKTSVDSVRREMLTKMKFPYPCIEEQKKIADFLSMIDSKISIELQNLEQLHSQKKAFMQHMFI